MIKRLKPSERFIRLLTNGKFKKPELIKIQQLGCKQYDETQINKNLENYKFFMNSSCYDEIAKEKVKKYNGDNFE